jgi:hypothetical protein
VLSKSPRKVCDGERKKERKKKKKERKIITKKVATIFVPNVCNTTCWCKHFTQTNFHILLVSLAQAKSTIETSYIQKELGSAFDQN